MNSTAIPADLAVKPPGSRVLAELDRHLRPGGGGASFLERLTAALERAVYDGRPEHADLYRRYVSQLNAQDAESVKVNQPNERHRWTL